jgi:hypothetical protein
VEIKLPVHHLKAFLGLGKILLWFLYVIFGLVKIALK